MNRPFLRACFGWVQALPLRGEHDRCILRIFRKDLIAMCREESQKRIVIRAMEVRLWILWVWQDVIHIEVLERDAFRFDSLKIKRAQNRFIVSFRVDDEMVDGFDASVFCDGIQRATRDGELFELESRIAFLEVEVIDVAVGRGGHLV